MKSCNINFLRLLASSTVVFSLAFSPMAVAGAIGGAGIISGSSPQPLPDMTYSDASGMPRKVGANGNKLTAVHFWATWCVPCVSEIVEIDKTLKIYKNKGFAVIALSEDGTRNSKKVQQFFKNQKIETLTVAMDSGMKAMQKIKARGLPTTLFLNADGKIIGRSEGTMDWHSKEVRSFIEAHLQ
jgi:thiol-disulfide isomerase/thioredoxin